MHSGAQTYLFASLKQRRHSGAVSDLFVGLIQFDADRQAVEVEAGDRPGEIERAADACAVPQRANLGPTYDWADNGFDYCA